MSGQARAFDERTSPGTGASLSASCSFRLVDIGPGWPWALGAKVGGTRGSLGSRSQVSVPGRAPRDAAGSLGCPWALVIPD